MSSVCTVLISFDKLIEFGESPVGLYNYLYWSCIVPLHVSKFVITVNYVRTNIV